MLFQAFSLSYLTASTITFFTDIFYPSLRETKIAPVDIIQEYTKIFKVSIPNILSSYPLFIFYQSYLADEERGEDNFLPLSILGWLILTDISFYTFHRLLHHPKFYHFHKDHHSYKYTYGPAALYSSTLEYYLSNLAPNIISFEILQLSMDEMYYIIVFQTFYTVIVSHGGYSFFKEGHLKHHITFKEPYGLLLTDRVVGLLNRPTTPLALDRDDT